MVESYVMLMAFRIWPHHVDQRCYQFTDELELYNSIQFNSGELNWIELKEFHMGFELNWIESFELNELKGFHSIRFNSDLTKGGKSHLQPISSYSSSFFLQKLITLSCAILLITRNSSLC